MSNITFDDPLCYQFAEVYVKRWMQEGYRAILNEDVRNIFVENDTLSGLLKRVVSADSTILPCFSKDTDHWLLTARNHRALDQTMARIQPFIIPTYAQFTKPRWLNFDENGSPFQQLGNQLYPTGYFHWVSPRKNRHVILERLALWLNLEQKQPVFKRIERRSYRSLSQAFDLALAARNWDEAQTIIDELRQSHLTTAYNLNFLRYRLLATQQQWQQIWEDNEYPILAKLRVPPSVRRVMLTAFHNRVLMPLEQQSRWDDAIVAFQTERHKLDALLTTRAELTQSPVLSVFGYLALHEQDEHRLGMLRGLARESAARHCLTELQRRLVPATPPPPVQTPLEQMREALSTSDFDTVREWLQSAEITPDTALLYLDLAYDTREISTCWEAWNAFGQLSTEQQTQLKAMQRHIAFYLQDITTWIEEEESESSESLNVHSWDDWFDAVEHDPQDTRLYEALQHLITVNPNIAVDIPTLNEQLLKIVVEETLLLKSCTDSLFSYLADRFINNDDLFPREENSYIELYDILRTKLLGDSVNETNVALVLRFMDANLRVQPEKCKPFVEELNAWLDTPRSALQSAILEAFELLANYGVESWQIDSLYQKWVIDLLERPITIDALSWQVWHDFGDWIKVSSKLLANIQAKITEQQAQEPPTPIADLPSAFSIAIFTLGEGSAARAKRLLLERNHTLDVKICVEKSMNERVKSLARNCDMAVVVTTCLKHAIFNGITPYLQNMPVYPQSSGSTSIIRAIEKAAL